MALCLAFVEEGSAPPGDDGPRSRHLPDRQRGGSTRPIKAEERLAAFPLAPLDPAERRGRSEIDDFELGHPLAEARPEPGALPERNLVLNARASWQPVGEPGRRAKTLTIGASTVSIRVCATGRTNQADLSFLPSPLFSSLIYLPRPQRRLEHPLAAESVRHDVIRDSEVPRTTFLFRTSTTAPPAPPATPPSARRSTG